MRLFCLNRHDAKRFHGSGLAGASPVKSDWEASSSSQASEHDLALLLHPGSAAPGGCMPPPADADHSGLLLCCEEGLELEDMAAGICAAAAARQQQTGGGGECSPRSWDGHASYSNGGGAPKDGRCYSASTSDSQDSKGAGPLTPACMHAHRTCGMALHACDALHGMLCMLRRTRQPVTRIGCIMHCAGSSFVLASKLGHPDYDASSASPDDSCLLQPTSMSSTPSPTGAIR